MIYVAMFLLQKFALRKFHVPDFFSIEDSFMELFSKHQRIVNSTFIYLFTVKNIDKESRPKSECCLTKYLQICEKNKMMQFLLRK